MPDATAEHLLEIGNEVEFEACPCPRQRDRAKHERHHHEQQADHHDLRDALDTFLQTEAAHEKADHDDREHPTEHFGRAAEHRREHACDPFDALTDELAGGHLRHVSEHPATHNGVEHHQDHAADIRPPTEPVPFT